MSVALPPSARRLERGKFVRLCYQLGQSKASGVLSLEPDQGTSEQFILRHGQLFTHSSDALGRQTRRRLETLAQVCCHANFDVGLAAIPPSVGRPFSLLDWARSHLESQIDAARAQDLVRELAGVRLALLADKLPHANSLDATDRRILDAMRMPRRLDQIWPMARTPRFRLLCFIHFLRSVGALREQGVSAVAQPAIGSPGRQRQAMATLGLRAMAGPKDIKRAYRRLARCLHPDLNSAKSVAHRRACEQRLVDVNSAYRELMQAL